MNPRMTKVGTQEHLHQRQLDNKMLEHQQSHLEHNHRQTTLSMESP